MAVGGVEMTTESFLTTDRSGEKKVTPDCACGAKKSSGTIYLS